jgi:hypothetical protein
MLLNTGLQNRTIAAVTESKILTVPVWFIIATIVATVNKSGIAMELRQLIIFGAPRLVGPVRIRRAQTSVPAMRLTNLVAG